MLTHERCGREEAGGDAVRIELSRYRRPVLYAARARGYYAGPVVPEGSTIEPTNLRPGLTPGAAEKPHRGDFEGSRGSRKYLNPGFNVTFRYTPRAGIRKGAGLSSATEPALSPVSTVARRYVPCPG